MEYAESIGVAHMIHDITMSALMNMTDINWPQVVSFDLPLRKDYDLHFWQAFQTLK